MVNSPLILDNLSRAKDSIEMAFSALPFSIEVRGDFTLYMECFIYVKSITFSPPQYLLLVHFTACDISDYMITANFPITLITSKLVKKRSKTVSCCFITVLEYFICGYSIVHIDPLDPAKHWSW